MVTLTAFKNGARRFGKWILAAAALIIGLLAVNAARKHDKRAKRTVDKAISALESDKSNAVERAAKLQEKADKHHTRAEQAKQEALDAAKKAEDAGHAPMADRIRRWNDGVRDKPPG